MKTQWKLFYLLVLLCPTALQAEERLEDPESKPDTPPAASESIPASTEENTPATSDAQPPVTPSASTLPKAKTPLTPTPDPSEVPPPQITPGPSISLAEALEQAEQRNLDLLVAKMEVNKARAKLSTTWGLLHPIVQGKLDYTHMDHEDTVDLSSEFTPLLQIMGITLPEGTSMGEPLLTNPQDKVTGALEVMVPLFNAENWLTIKVAEQGVKVAELSIEQAKRQILLGVAQSYYMALTTRDLIDFYHSQIVTTKEQLRIAGARFNAGRGMRIDVIRAETDMEKASQSLRSALLGYDNARDVLGNLIGSDELPMPIDTSDLSVPKGELSVLEQNALKDRLDIKTEAAKIELSNRQLSATWMKFLPTLNLAGQVSYQFTEMVDLGSNDRSRWAVMLSLTVPIYNYFRYADLDEKRAQLKQANLAYENSKQKATLAVRKAKRDYANALTQVATAEKQAALAEEGLKLVEAAYRAGATTSLDVTEARQVHTAAGFNLTTSQFKAQLALLSLIDAVGEDLTGDDLFKRPATP